MAYDNNSSEGRARAEHLLRQQGEMESERANLDTLYQRIAERVCPEGEIFTTKHGMQGELGGERVFDNTPGLALDRFAAAIVSFLVPDSEQWHGLKSEEPEIAEDEEVKEWCEQATDVLFAVRYRSQANFSAQMYSNIRSLGAYGPWCMFVDETMGAGLRYKSLHLSELFFGENHQGIVDRVHRKFELKAYQVEQLCNEPDPAKRWIMPEAVKKALDASNGKSNPNATFEFVHCVYPNEEWQPRFADYRGMDYSSTYVCVADRSVVNTNGFRTMPYAVGRYMMGPRETYGRSPAMTVFRDILMLNEMNKTVIRAGQQHVDPAWLIHEDGALQGFSLKSRALNPGMVTDDGRPLALPLRPEGDLVVGLELIQDRRKAVNDAFMISLFDILVDGPMRTATEALLRAQERGQIMGPAMTRQQDALGVMIAREIDILMAAGQLPPMPDALLDAGGALAVDFKAPVNRLQQTDKAVGHLRTIEALTPAAQIDPTVFDIYKGKWHKVARTIAEANGAPVSDMNSDEEMAELAQKESQQQQFGELVQAAPQIGKTIRDITQAQATASNVPQPIPQVAPR